MPTIFDNIENDLLTSLNNAIESAYRGDFCVGYFNLRGWRTIDSGVEAWDGGEGKCCRLLVGMQRLTSDEIEEAYSLIHSGEGLDNRRAIKMKKRMADEFRHQLTLGAPTDQDEKGLRRLVRQLKDKKVLVKLYLRHTLHAKLYLAFRQDDFQPVLAFLGSSNLTMAGLSRQGELNVDVADQDSAKKLEQWFNDRWSDQWCIDISEELIQVIEESWARLEPIPPYHIYLKIAYHLSQEARTGLTEFQVPADIRGHLLDFQSAAVSIAAHHLNKRDGVLVGDVVGLGKTRIATALARVMGEDYGLETLVLCPKNLTRMWEDYAHDFGLSRYKVLSISQAIKQLPKLRRYRIVVVDESQNLRNREGKIFKAVQDYIARNDSKVILLSATPYNKSYLDLSNQLRLFLPEDRDIGIRPEQLLRTISETEFSRRHQCPVRSLAAFEKSEHPDDWRELMRLYMVRRTRSFIMANYAKTDDANGRKYLEFPDGSRSYFPDRIPKTVTFHCDEKDPDDPYARLYASDVIDAVNGLELPRYGLKNYLAPTPTVEPTKTEDEIITDLSRAGKRLMGFCRTNLFKRLESSAHAFVLSIQRQILRNYIVIHAIEKGLPIPIGAQDTTLLDPQYVDCDEELFNDDQSDKDDEPASHAFLAANEETYKSRAAEIYAIYDSTMTHRFRWLRSELFVDALCADLQSDSLALLDILKNKGGIDPAKDTKLQALRQLVQEEHPERKFLVFSQFADTVTYLQEQLTALGVDSVEAATGGSADPTTLAWRFSPHSNNKTDQFPPQDEIRVLLATDVLSEGQNLQDAFCIVNYDLPWAIVRLIQRAGRVDRIGQASNEILCYSFLPAEGVEQIIRLRGRLRQRLKENEEVVGSDEEFFDDQGADGGIADIYNEKAGVFDGDTGDSEVDLSSLALQIWNNATEAEPKLEETIKNMPAVVYSTRHHQPTGSKPEGVLVYVQTSNEYDALAWIDKEGSTVTESQFDILQAAECKPDSPAVDRLPNHHDLVTAAAKLIAKEESTTGGQLGRPSGARFKTYERLKDYASSVQGTLFDTPKLKNTLQEIYQFPLQQSSIVKLNRALKTGTDDQALAELVMALRDEDQLCIIHRERGRKEPRIICSLGMVEDDGD